MNPESHWTVAQGVVLTNIEKQAHRSLTENAVGGEGIGKEWEQQVRQSALSIFQRKVGQNLEKASNWTLGSGKSLFCGECYPRQANLKTSASPTSMLNRKPSDD